MDDRPTRWLACVCLAALVSRESRDFQQAHARNSVPSRGTSERVARRAEEPELPAAELREPAHADPPHDDPPRAEPLHDEAPAPHRVRSEAPPSAARLLPLRSRAEEARASSTGSRTEEPRASRGSSTDETRASITGSRAEEPRPSTLARHELVPPCQGELGLVGTAVNEGRPQLSWVAIRTPTGATVVAVGGRVLDFTVLAIRPAGSVLRAADGAPCALSTLSSKPRAPQANAPPAHPEADDPAEPVPHGKPVFSAQELAEGVRALSDFEYRVSKPFLLKALTNPGGSVGTAWFRAAEQEGRNLGMEARGVRAGSALAAMGIHEGDIVRDLNGIALDSAGGLIAALRAARENAQVVIAIVRDGQPRDLRYRVE